MKQTAEATNADDALELKLDRNGASVRTIDGSTPRRSQTLNRSGRVTRLNKEKEHLFSIRTTNSVEGTQKLLYTLVRETS